MNTYFNHFFRWAYGQRRQAKVMGSRFIIGLSLGLIWMAAVATAAPSRPETVQGQGKFYSAPDDTLEFIKEQLLASAFRDVLGKELAAMDFAVNDFWEKYDAAFTESFRGVEEKYKERISHQIKSFDERIAKAEDPKAKSKLKTRKAEVVSELEKNLRLRKLKAHSDFENIARAIKSFSVVKMSRATNDPQQRSITVQAKVDRPYLAQLYNRMMRDHAQTVWRNLYITLDLTMEGVTGAASGGEQVEAALLHNWTTFGQEQWGDLVQSVSNEASAATLASQAALPDKIGEIQNSAGWIHDRPDVWLQLKVQVQQVSEDEFSKLKRMVTRGEFTLLALRTGKILLSGTLNETDKNYSVQDGHDFGSALATTISTSAGEALKKVRPALENTSSQLRTFALEIVNPGSMATALEILNWLKANGIRFQLGGTLQKYTPGQAVMVITSSASEQDAQALLAQLAKQVFNGHRVKYDPARPYRCELGHNR